MNLDTYFYIFFEKYLKPKYTRWMNAEFLFNIMHLLQNIMKAYK